MKPKDDYRFIAHFYDLLFVPLLKGIRNNVIELSMIKDKTSVLEVACGTGEQAGYYARKGAIVTALDFSKPMLKIAKQKNKEYKTLHFIYSDATKLQFRDNQFDISTITLALHEMDPSIREKVVKQMIRVTKKDGRIIIVDYTVPKSKNIWSIIICLTERMAGGDHYKNYRHFMTNKGLQELIKDLPLKLKNKRLYYGGNLSIFNLSIKK